MPRFTLTHKEKCPPDFFSTSDEKKTDAEIYKTYEDLRAHDVDIVTLGQYLRPTLNHHPIDRWVTPEEFEQYRLEGLKHNFLEVISGPMVRSSYRAERALDFNNAGL